MYMYGGRQGRKCFHTLYKYCSGEALPAQISSQAVMSMPQQDCAKVFIVAHVQTVSGNAVRLLLKLASMCIDLALEAGSGVYL